MSPLAPSADLLDSPNDISSTSSSPKPVVRVSTPIPPAFAPPPRRSTHTRIVPQYLKDFHCQQASSLPLC
ncbi:hypothetical protein CJ030_MR7G007522 [Morella rubra]|uniref:Uncharacterized protein n=1 Tax=Morella rubra TaxID=262757 RepID=A0A6A1V485_9ROSI|nr:hypothetical protein CJ030_MR7G007522 [Morella rubra]